MLCIEETSYVIGLRPIKIYLPTIEFNWALGPLVFGLKAKFIIFMGKMLIFYMLRTMSIGQIFVITFAQIAHNSI